MVDHNYYSNAILIGYIDSYCLVCETYFSEREEVRQHIDEPTHITNLSSAKLFDKYKDEDILKVKQGYYCVPCNTVFHTAVKVSLHVAGASHRSNYGARFLRREDAEVVYHDRQLDARAWHGVVGDTCAVCNVDVEDGNEHQKESTHLFNLAKSNVEFMGKDVYRKIDDATFQCITCNAVLPLNVLNSHFQESEHAVMSKKCYDALINSKMASDGFVDCELSDCGSSTSKYSSVDDDAETADHVQIKDNKQENITKILESVSTFEKNEVNINFERETAFCKKCLGIITFDCKAIENHIDGHKKNPMKRDFGYVPFQCEVDMKIITNEVEQKSKEHTKRMPAIDFAEDKRTTLDANHNITTDVPKPNVNNTKKVAEGASKLEDPAEFAKVNQITYNKTDNNCFCRICKTRIPARLRSMKEHVAGKSHKQRLNTRKTCAFAKSITSKMAMSDYLEEVYYFNTKELPGEVVVNRKLCIDKWSFHLVTKVGGWLRCHACEVSFSEEVFKPHSLYIRHRVNLYSTPIIMKHDTEFVREIRPGLFHCGFCNQLESSLQTLALHLSSDAHSHKKTLFGAKLQIYVAKILDDEREERVRAFLMRMMLVMSPFMDFE